MGAHDGAPLVSLLPSDPKQAFDNVSMLGMKASPQAVTMISCNTRLYGITQERERESAAENQKRKDCPSPLFRHRRYRSKFTELPTWRLQCLFEAPFRSVSDSWAAAVLGHRTHADEIAESAVPPIDVLELHFPKVQDEPRFVDR